MSITPRFCIAAVLAYIAAAVSLASGPATATFDPEPYRPVARKIFEHCRRGTDAYRKLETLCVEIGHRLSGSKSLDRAIDWAAETLRADGQENVRTEPVEVVRWVRGRESCELIEPYPRTIPMLGLGGSIATPPDGITAEVLCVRDEQELEKRADEARGKIVLFNFPMPADKPETGHGYGVAVRYRAAGASMAAKHGAVAALVRSVTTRSLSTPHTGGMRYRDGVPKIPAAAITVEYAELIDRLTRRGQRVVVRLKMQARTDPKPAMSANVLGELVGREKPDEIVVIGGHIDSWDVGQGAHDDGGGCVTAIEALSVLRKLGLRPRRTIRVVLFTNEENGLAGARTYAKTHADELPRHVAAIESDSGMFALRGFGVSMADKDRQKRAVAQLEQILPLFAPLRENLRIFPGRSGADVGPLRPAGVATMGQIVDMTHYFDYHHTDADTIDKVDPKLLDENVAAMALMAYILADMPQRLGQP